MQAKNRTLFLSQRHDFRLHGTGLQPSRQLCRTQASGLRSNRRQHQRREVTPKFIEKNQLPFTLIADTEHKLVETFGVWGEKSMYGRKYMGTFRTTFIINEEGIIERIISPKEVKTKDHASQILQ